MKNCILWTFALWLGGTTAGPLKAEAAARAGDRTGDVVVLKDVMVPMRDGVKLATDLYVPAENGRPAEARFPAVLLRTPYNKAAWGTELVRFFAQHGYLSATQDCRGRFASEGTFFPFLDDPKDGHDTIVWLAEHPLCNGKVGMHGPSYMAWTQFHAATQHPPGLVTMVPFHGPTNAYHYSLRCGGALHLGLLRWILSVAVTSQEAARDPAAGQAVNEMLGSGSFLEWAARIPWQRGQTPLARIPQYEDAAMQLYFENPDYTAFWRQPGLAMDEHFASFPDMPVLWVSSWFDWYPRTISDGYQAMVKMGRKNQHLLIGPWSHNNFECSLGDVNFGNEGGTIGGYDDFLNLELAWFDRWMKDDRSAPIGAPVRVFVMGGGDGRRGAGGRLNHGGRWQSGEAWPPQSARPTQFYLREQGVLSREKPAEAQSSRTYRYDPGNTVSSNGRCIIAYGPAASSGFRGMGPRDQIELETLPGHGMPGRPIAERPDVLVYQTAPLSEDVSRGGERVRCPVGLVRRARHRFLREASGRVSGQRRLSPRVRVSGIRRDPAGSLSRELREADFDETRPDLSPRVSAGAGGQPVQGRASDPRGHLQQQLPQLRHQPEHRRSQRPPSADRRQYRPS